MKFLKVFLSCSLWEDMQKSDSKTGGDHAIFSVLEVKRSKILQKSRKGDSFCLHSWFLFYGVSGAKTDLHNKYMI